MAALFQPPPATMLDKLNQLSESHGSLKTGHGLVSGVVALVLAVLCFLGVLAFHFPEYLTTPQLRKSYDVDVMRQLLYWSMVVTGAIALFNIAFGRVRWLSASAFALIGLTLALGGATRCRSTTSPTTRRTSGSTGSSSTCSARR